ncbi:DUF3846 domain-containing protein [Streptomyces violaceusniger]|uniref:DUF3846 domain-containing protein n=1 Tax=Streptomyces violaceusniger TaxID=68280 RepID=UPI0034326C84
MTTATVNETFALWVPPTGQFRLVHWHTIRTPQNALCSDTVRPVTLTSELTMWTDEGASPLRLPRNPRASELMIAYQPHPGDYFGDALFTGATDVSGDVVHGLTFDQAITLIDLYVLGVTASATGPQDH